MGETKINLLEPETYQTLILPWLKNDIFEYSRLLNNLERICQLRPKKVLSFSTLLSAFIDSFRQAEEEFYTTKSVAYVRQIINSAEFTDFNKFSNFLIRERIIEKDNRGAIIRLFQPVWDSVELTDVFDKLKRVSEIKSFHLTAFFNPTSLIDSFTSVLKLQSIFFGSNVRTSNHKKQSSEIGFGFGTVNTNQNKSSGNQKKSKDQQQQQQQQQNPLVSIAIPHKSQTKQSKTNSISDPDKDDGINLDPSIFKTPTVGIGEMGSPANNLKPSSFGEPPSPNPRAPSGLHHPLPPPSPSPMHRR
eukprot:TRINITY_DN7348_c0_g1_i2.p1 TRINITY_DN7348_c0_g1~~TRINITY_DN7348_c0_g1_i2.p1  ORF type:complete len:303 (+),score=35.99 TRINITY_DN7348_c0_g1_i2:3-911(+)